MRIIHLRPVLRLRQLLQQSNNSTNIMKAVIITCLSLAVCTITTLADRVCVEQITDECQGLTMDTVDPRGRVHCCPSGYSSISTSTSTTNGVTDFECTCRESGLGFISHGNARNRPGNLLNGFGSLRGFHFGSPRGSRFGVHGGFRFGTQGRFPFGGFHFRRPGHSPSGVTDGISDDIPSDAGGVSGGTAGGVSGGTAVGVSGGTAVGASGAAAGSVSVGTAGGVSGGTAGGVFGGTAGGVSGGAAGGVFDGPDDDESDGTDGGESDGTDGGESDGTDGGESDGTDGGVSDGTDGGESGGAPTAADKDPLEEYRQKSLAKHNELRARHGCPDLVLSDDLNDFAQNWAEHLAANNLFNHSGRTLPSGKKIGENIAMNSSSAGADYEGPEPVQQWYSEISKYNFETNFPNWRVTGHFTQVIWKSSTELGVGKARSADGRTVVAVANYRPPGNDVTAYPENVPRLL
ncbi:Golgi-associated plant pathogenesis-related protein 1 [Plakobranchus ocellatus]|uniref:Golgi-associated plant pathogenesis-related protein 1 n=1 Tax=Plakobranchus ocellatus TaxID=259542 RepID=A0AAV4DZS1_9GAST|nr:Golgi-associated plant pathogenesis-related protein 1 [Plakobranchus ocellatus]